MKGISTKVPDPIPNGVRSEFAPAPAVTTAL